MRNILLFHTSSKVVNTIEEVIFENNLNVFPINFVDENILKLLFDKNDHSKEIETIIYSYVQYFNSIDVIAIQSTCTSISPYIEKLKTLVNKPIYTVDEIMISQIKQQYKKPLIIFTVESTIKPTLGMFGKVLLNIDLEYIFLPEAFEYRMNNNFNMHNQIIIDAINKFNKEFDCVILPQSSMLVGLHEIRSQINVPVLSGIESSLKYICQSL
jgi:hypothetical protein